MGIVIIFLVFFLQIPHFGETREASHATTRAAYDIDCVCKMDPKTEFIFASLL